MHHAVASPRPWWSFSEFQRTLAAVLLVGGACGLLAVVFQAALFAAEHTLIRQAEHAPGRWWLLLTVLCPTLGGLLAGVLSSLGFAGARGSGVAQVKAAYGPSASALPLQDGAVKFLVSTVQIGSGASLGAQGPIVHMCAALSRVLGCWLALRPRLVQQLLPVGAAAGVAAAFNAPLGAAAFVLEAIVGQLPRKLLVALVPAVLLAAGIGQLLPVQPQLSWWGLDTAPPSVWCLPAYALLGALAGLVAVGFQRNVLRLRALFDRNTLLPGWAKPAAGGLATGVCALLGLCSVQSAGVAGLGFAQLAEALHGSLPLATLLVLGVLKFGATLFSVASGGSGGVFAPSLFMGAMLGGALGWLGQQLPGADPLRAFTLVGMSAVFTGMVRAPIASVCIVCELTGATELLPALVVASSCAYLVARRCDRLGLYDALLGSDGTRLPERPS